VALVEETDECAGFGLGSLAGIGLSVDRIIDEVLKRETGRKARTDGTMRLVDDSIVLEM